MIRAHSLYTQEIDIADDAVADIQAQLKNISLMSNTVGIMVCHYDCVDTGVYEAICNHLPFPIVGFTTFNQATNRTMGLFEITITVMTSDDVRFAVAKGIVGEGATADGAAASIQATYEAASAGNAQQPALAFSFLTPHLPFSGDAYLRQMDALTGSAPHFGAVATGEDDGDGAKYVLHQGEVIPLGFAQLLLYGHVDARFYFGSFPEEILLNRYATVTEADGLWVRSLNGQPAIRFMQKDGFEFTEKTKQGITVIPFVHHWPDEEIFVGRTMIDYNDEGHALFLGEIPEGSVMRSGASTMQATLSVTEDIVRTAIGENEDASLMLLFSCLGRYITLGMDTNSEIECIQRDMRPDMPYLMCYAAGEICPIENDGKLKNRYHNSSLIVCAIR